jgi:hypothetical protein
VILCSNGVSGSKDDEKRARLTWFDLVKAIALLWIF